MTSGDDIKAKRADLDERKLLDQQIAKRRKDKPFMARIRAAIKREQDVFDRLRDR